MITLERWLDRADFIDSNTSLYSKLAGIASRFRSLLEYDLNVTSNVVDRCRISRDMTCLIAVLYI